MTTEQGEYRAGRAREQLLPVAGQTKAEEIQTLGQQELEVPDYSEWTSDGNYEYRLYGYENQALEINLSPADSVQTEKGAMAWRHETVIMNTGLGRDTGVFGAMRRRWSGESILVNTYTNEGGRSAVVGLTPQMPSHILGIPLDPSNPDLILKKGSYIASTPGMEISIAINRRMKISMVSRNFNLVMQKISGKGTVFITSNGIMLEKHLKANDSLLIQVGNLIAIENTVQYDLAMNRGFRNLTAGGEGIFMMKVSGPGRVWIQTTPRREEAKALMDSLRR